jgi:hypothetical protein
LDDNKNQKSVSLILLVKKKKDEEERSYGRNHAPSFTLYRRQYVPREK